MAEYIEREATIKAIKLYAYRAIAEGKENLDVVDDIICMCGEIKAQPAADVVPVVHGEWLESKKMLRSNQRVCSTCSNTVRQSSYDRKEYTPYPYCPYCGAKMDGGADDVNCKAETIC